MLIVILIDEKTGADNVTGADVRLNFGNIAETPNLVGIFAGGESENDHVVIFAVDAVEEPNFAFLDGARKGEARIHFVERPAVLVLHRRDEIGGGEAEMVISNSG